MQNKIVILGVLVIFFMAMVIFNFNKEFFMEGIVEGNTPPPVAEVNIMTFDENNSIGAAHATQIRKLLKQIKPYGKLSNSEAISKVVAIGDTQPALTSILESNISNKDKVGALNTLFGLISNGLERNLLIHYNNFTPRNHNSAGSYPHIANNSKNPFMENQSDYDAKIVVNSQYENTYDSQVTAVNANSLYLNGQRDKSGTYLKIPILPSFETDDGTFSGFSVSAWFYPNTVSNNSWNRLFDFGNGMAQQNLLMSYSADGILGRIHTGSTVVDTYSLRKTMPNIMGQWNHYAWTIDSAGKWNIYLNNRILTSGITGIPEMVERKSNFIGYSNWAKNGDDLYNGWIDDFRIYDRPLSTEEVTQLYRLASRNVRNIIEGAELPIDIKIPPVPSYIITNGTTNVQSPIDWKQEGETTATAVISNASQDVLNGTYVVKVSSSLNFGDAQEWASSCFNGIYSDPKANNFGGNFYSWVSKRHSYYKTTSPYGYINSTSDTFSTTISRKSYNGEWVQLQLPTKILIKSFYLHYAEANIGGIMGAVLAGSLDGNSWKLLYTLTNETVPKPKSIGYYTFNTNTIAYSHYRFIITHANVVDQIVGINELILST